MALEIFGCISTTWCLVSAVFTLMAVWFWQSCKDLKTWKRLGIKGPTPFPFTGNMVEMQRKGITEICSQWKETYGKVYGIYMPLTPTLVVHDLDILKDVLIKRFPSFANRQPQRFFNTKPFLTSLLVLRDDHWKHVRNMLSPTFSSGKLKRIFPVLDQVSRSLVSFVKSKAETGEPVELKLLCGNFSMDVIAGAGFGIQVNSIHNPKDPFYKHGLSILNQKQWLVAIILMFPWMTPILRKLGFSLVSRSAIDFFLHAVDSAIEERHHEEDQKKYHDFLQLLVEAEKENKSQTFTKSEVDTEIDHGDQLKTSSQWTRKGLTLDEIESNAVTFILAGYDTVSAVMSFTLFCLAAHQDCLQKVQAELDEKLGKKSMTYENAHEMTYMEMCMNEAMRLYPPGFILDRQAAEDTDLNGYRIEKGMRLLVPVIAIHTDPEIWPDPLKYDPERHTPEARATRHPFSFIPFGMGPRNCIGMRMAQLEIKMALASVLQNYSPVLCEKSVYPPKLLKFRMAAADGLWVKFKSRARVVAD